MENCLFRDLGGDSLHLEGCQNVILDGKNVSGNYRMS